MIWNIGNKDYVTKIMKTPLYVIVIFFGRRVEDCNK